MVSLPTGFGSPSFSQPVWPHLCSTRIFWIFSFPFEAGPAVRMTRTCLSSCVWPRKLPGLWTLAMNNPWHGCKKPRGWILNGFSHIVTVLASVLLLPASGWITQEMQKSSGNSECLLPLIYLQHLQDYEPWALTNQPGKQGKMKNF